ncbi:flagellar hook-length control protein FliK [Abyssisolibacter fermentans]|uniref:flagellar hook-length control protein FliK n=1 Tax=Abyssisolibacter fermentans TaxID=1766203 RepID=UPI00082C7538|nr:flagellar hook-length control protein FliK [Abyssisolibacter fermentans]
MKISNQTNLFDQIMVNNTKQTSKKSETKKSSFEEMLNNSRKTSDGITKPKDNKNTELKEQKTSELKEKESIKPEDKETIKSKCKEEESIKNKESINEKKDLTEEEKAKDEHIIEEVNMDAFEEIIELLTEAGIDVKNIDLTSFEEISNEVDLKTLVNDIELLFKNNNISKEVLSNKLEKIVNLKETNVLSDKKEIIELLSKIKEEVSELKNADQITNKDDNVNNVKIINMKQQSVAGQMSSLIRNKNTKQGTTREENSESTVLPIKSMGNIIKNININNINSSGAQLNLSDNTVIDQQVKTDSALVRNIDYKNILEQVTKSTTTIINEKQSMVNIKLKPESLGNMTLKIVVEEGKVVAEAVVENQAVKNILISNMDELKENLSGQGLDIQKLDVSVGKDSMFGQKNSTFQNRQKFEKKSVKKIEDMDIVEDNYLDTGVVNHYSSSINVIA